MRGTCCTASSPRGSASGSLTSLGLFHELDESSRHSRASLRKALPLAVVLTVLWETNWVLFPRAVGEASVWTFRATCLLGARLLSLGIATCVLSPKIKGPRR